MKTGDTLGGIAEQDGRHGRGRCRSSTRSSIRRRWCRGRRSSCASDRFAPASSRRPWSLALALARRRHGGAGPSPPSPARAGRDPDRRARRRRAPRARTPMRRRPIASTTKLMTALLTLERADLDDVFTAPAYQALTAESKIDLRTGERMRVATCCARCCWRARTTRPRRSREGVAGSRAAFVRADERARARARARRHELREPDRARRPRQLLERARPRAARARSCCATRRSRASSTRRRRCCDSGSHRASFDNRNDLVVSQPFVDGVKTGHTRRAGYVLVGAAGGPGGSRVDQRRAGRARARPRATPTRLRCCATASPSSAAARSSQRRAVEARRSPTATSARSSSPRATRSSCVRKGQRITKRSTRPGEVEGELAAGTRVGRITVLRDGKVVDACRS